MRQGLRSDGFGGLGRGVRHLGWRLRLAAGAGAAAAALAGCGGPSSPPASSGGSGPGQVVKTAQATVGGSTETVLTNSAGRTLYYLTKDSAGKATCTGSCSSIWPALTTTANSVASPSGASGSFSVFSGSDGHQVQYNGHPLYTYSGDTGPDQTNGEGVMGIWYVATPSLAAAASASPSSGGYGY